MTLRATHNSRFRSSATLAVGVMLLTSGLARAQTDPLDVLSTPTSSEAIRLEAASVLLQEDDLSGRERRRLIRILDPNSDDPIAQRLLLVAIAARPMVHIDFEEPIIELVARGDPQIRPQALLALASVGTWEAARVLVNHSAPFQAAEVSKASVDALIRMSGRSDIGADTEAWRDWLDDRQDLEPDQWRDELVRGLTLRIETLAVSEHDATTRAVDGFRRLYMVAPFQDKSPLLAELLLVDGDLRDLAIELIYRELSQGNQLDEVVGQSAIELLAHQTPEVRAESAKLISTLSPRDAGIPVTEALVRETSPVAAAAILNASARWPGVAVISPALRWLEFGAATRDASSKLLLALDDEGLLTSPADRRRVAGALRAAGPNRLTPEGVRLIVRMGTDDDREAVAALLEPGSKRDLQIAAASELSRRPEFFDRIIAAAERDPSLYQAAVTATISHRRNTQGYALVRSLAPTDNQRRAGVLAIARALEPRYLLESARVHEPDAELRNTILSTMSRVATTPAEQEAIDRAMVLLAETNLELARPADALSALQSVSDNPSEEVKTNVALNETIAYLWLNRIDEAIDAGASPDAWISALELIGSEPHAEVVAQVALDRFGNVLSSSEQDMLNSIITVTDAETKPPTTDEGG
ncbi:MAG: hypothetical protein ED559_06810 [Phycisphaera sp.]|nr:MAG: hypothetical protein ED559_06810 [Phycisphaera sp.]